MSETRLPRLKYIATLFQAPFSSTSVFFHVLISLERAFAFSLAASPSSNNHQSLQLQCCYCVGSWENCGCNEFSIF